MAMASGKLLTQYGLTVAMIFALNYSTAAQTKTPPRRPGPMNQFYRALERAYAEDDKKKGGIGPFKITEEVWRQSFAQQGKYEDCEDREYSLQVLERWWAKFYPEAIKGRDFEVLARTVYAGQHGEQDSDAFWFWRKVQRQMPFQPDTP